MSILIKGIEMPTSCKECRLLQESDERYECAINSYLAFGGEEFVPDYVMNGCPLVPIPPHGRLIDGDELFDKMYFADGEPKTVSEHINSIVHFMSTLASMPTIIPADKDGAE